MPELFRDEDFKNGLDQLGSKGPSDLPQQKLHYVLIHPICVHQTPCNSSCLPWFNILLTFLLSCLLCGQGPRAIRIINIVLSALVRRESKCCFHDLSSVCYQVCLSPQSKKEKSVHIFETTKTKTQAVSLLFSSESCHCFV